MPEHIPDGAIHEWFSLTYANYLILPRSVLQSMPLEWQDRFVSCLRELDRAFGHLDWPDYDVRALKREREHIDHEDCPSCDGTGLVLDGGLPAEPEQSCDECLGEGTIEAERWETAEEVGIREDPIPHYNRGRTRLEPESS